MMNQDNENSFVICIDNRGFEASVERWKVYKRVPDTEAEKHSEMRIIDEEGEDYLYPANMFHPVHLEAVVAETFMMQAPVAT